MTNVEPAAEQCGEQPAAPTGAEAPVIEPPAAPEPTAVPETAVAAAPKRSWSMPKSPVTRKHADQLGRAALTIVTALGKAIAAVARFGAGAIRRLWRMAEAVPAALQLFAVAGVLMLLGVVGAIALHSTLGLVCTVVVIPVSAGILGALGHRWYSGIAAAPQRADTNPAAPAASDLQRSVEYVDRKLAVALTSFGTDHHQQAVIALFQAKTAVELTLGTEQDTASYADVPLRADDYGLRPRIRAGSASTSALRESNSLAAS
ncbi:hypothetical protein [Mycolicibacterium sp. CH28]|uniref:hypothetical protein n=1 Tax=Mycolicibacterium sp. CH28 TaxID=2512237 RepID=UPI001F389171|nr:hypothetical protein [Mycolicibacterium sp. CH28]